MSELEGKLAFITGASRGIGREMALCLAKAGCNIAVIGKTTKPHPKLDGTIFSVTEEIEALGVKALAVELDVRDDAAIESSMQAVAAQFGGIDILINNASAISLTPTSDTQMKRFDLMFGVNVRATFACSRAAIPYLRKSKHPHILTMSPPLDMKSKWFKDHLAYTMSKFGMSQCTLGLASELKEEGIAVNSLWPQTTIATAAISSHFPKEIWEASRWPSIVADAALWILSQNPKHVSGQFFIDEVVLRKSGVKDFEGYAVNKDAVPFKDLFIDSDI